MDIIDVIADQHDREQIERECLEWAGYLMGDRDIDGAIRILTVGANRLARMP